MPSYDSADCSGNHAVINFRETILAGNERCSFVGFGGGTRTMREPGI
jgi:hypothetical protein